jgi:DNA-binding transcriptional LysR family regulator
MDFDLRLLRHARALAEEGSFAKAARVLHITQPALSRSIRDLEERVGFQMFDRSGSRVVPTDLGHAFVDRARDLLAHAEALDREVALLKGSERGKLTVGTGPYTGAMFMGKALGAFIAAHPAVAVTVATGHWANLFDMLRRRELDIVVAQQPVSADAADLAITPLHDRAGVFIVRPGHPLTRVPAPSVQDVAAYPIATSARVGAAIAEVLRKARAGGRTAPADLACDSFPLMKDAVQRTDHVLLATHTMAEDALLAGTLVRLPLRDPRIAASFAVLRLASRTLPPVAGHLVEAIVAADAADFAREQQLEAKWTRAQPGPKPRRATRSRAATA